MPEGILMKGRAKIDGDLELVLRELVKNAE
jgi:hypothetical protein